MKVLTDNFQGKIVRYSTVSGNGILFNTLDVCWVLRILKRPLDSILNESCLNIAGVIEAALTEGKNSMSFIEWIESRFTGYDPETPVLPHCDDEWKLI